MRERLLVCDSCGVEHYYSKDELRAFVKDGCKCPYGPCGDTVHQDHGWVETECEICAGIGQSMCGHHS